MIALAAVIPVYNEEANLAALAAEWLPALRAIGAPFAVWFIDDGSTDASPEILRRLLEEDPCHIRTIRQANAGHGAACRRGYECALAAGAEWVLQIDSDGQCDPAYLGEFWRRREEAVCVFGDRRRRGDGWHRGAISSLCTALVSFRTGVRVRDANVPYRLIKRNALARALERVPPDFDLQNIALSVVLRQIEPHWAFVPIHFRPRAGGRNSIDLRRIAGMGWRMLSDAGRLRR